jgi:hypothetical protein
MDLLDYVAIFGPLAVALVAVWLGYRYQMVVADREVRREAYVRILGHVGRMMDCVEQVERLSFVSYLVRELDEAPGELDAERSAKARFAVAAAIDLATTIDPRFGWEDLPTSDSEVFRFVHERPGHIWSMIHARFEEERRRLRDEKPRVLLGRTRLWESRSGVHLFGALPALEFYLASLFHRIDEDTAGRVDWAPVERLFLTVQQAAVRDLHVPTRFSVGLIQNREQLPWPEGTPAIKVGAEDKGREPNERGRSGLWPRP